MYSMAKSQVHPCMLVIHYAVFKETNYFSYITKIATHCQPVFLL